MQKYLFLLSLLPSDPEIKLAKYDFKTVCCCDFYKKKLFVQSEKSEDFN